MNTGSDAGGVLQSFFDPVGARQHGVPDRCAQLGHTRHASRDHRQSRIGESPSPQAIQGVLRLRAVTTILAALRCRGEQRQCT